MKWDPLLRIFLTKMGPMSKDFIWKSNPFGRHIPVCLNMWVPPPRASAQNWKLLLKTHAEVQMVNLYYTWAHHSYNKVCQGLRVIRVQGSKDNLPIYDDRIWWSFIPIATTFLVTAAAAKMVKDKERNEWEKHILGNYRETTEILGQFPTSDLAKVTLHMVSRVD